MKSNQLIGLGLMILVAWLWTGPQVDPQRAQADPVAADVGLAAALLGWQPGVAPAPSPGPTPAPTTHSRANCPTGGYVTHGDGHRTRCPDCDPPYGDDGEAPADPPQLIEVYVPQTLAEALGVDDPRLASPAWTYPGSILSHLRSTHGVDSTGLSQREAVDLHNRLHNAESRGIPRGAVSTPLITQDCPDGLCPTDASGNIMAGDCPDGLCPSGSAGSAGSACGSGSGVVQRVRGAVARPFSAIKGLRSSRPIRSRLFCRGC